MRYKVSRKGAFCHNPVDAWQMHDTCVDTGSPWKLVATFYSEAKANSMCDMMNATDVAAKAAYDAMRCTAPRYFLTPRSTWSYRSQSKQAWLLLDRDRPGRVLATFTIEGAAMRTVDMMNGRDTTGEEAAERNKLRASLDSANAALVQACTERDKLRAERDSYVKELAHIRALYVPRPLLEAAESAVNDAIKRTVAERDAAMKARDATAAQFNEVFEAAKGRTSGVPLADYVKHLEQRVNAPSTPAPPAPSWNKVADLEDRIRIERQTGCEFARERDALRVVRNRMQAELNGTIAERDASREAFDKACAKLKDIRLVLER